MQAAPRLPRRLRRWRRSAQTRDLAGLVERAARNNLPWVSSLPRPSPLGMERDPGPGEGLGIARRQRGHHLPHLRITTQVEMERDIQEA